MSRDGTLANVASGWSDERRVLWTRTIIAIGCAAGLALSPRLWFGERSYPLAPIWSGLPDMPDVAARALYVAMFVLLGASLLRPVSRWPVYAFVALAGTWSLWDQSRWQPWFYQYLCMLLCLALATRPAATKQWRRSALNACRLIVAGTYFWSGVQKANASFVEVVYPWLAEPMFGKELSDFEAHLAYALPPLEIAFGLALLLPRLRLAALYMLTLMHATILYAIGPLGNDWNTVVWPWNLAMPAAAFALFFRSDAVTTRNLVWSGWSWPRAVVIVFFWLLPALSFWGRWDAYLSAALYSGNTIKGYLDISAEVRQRLPQSIQKQCGDPQNGLSMLSLADWSMEDLNVPAYPAERVFRAVHARFCAAYVQPGDRATLLIVARPAWNSTERASE